MKTETDKHSSSALNITAEKASTQKVPIKVYVVRGMFLVFLWWLITAFMPFIPSPLDAIKGVLHVIKRATDTAYYAANESSLQQSAQQVREVATEQIETDDAKISNDKKPKSRAVIEAEKEDSTLRTELKAISSAPPVKGKIINIVVIGSDARLGTSTLHADAIHLFTISPDSGIIEITSVPRDTYCDLGYPDTSSFNHITNARALGYPGFMKRVEELCKRGSVKYYVEAGFSQVMGILELFGYKDPVQTLKFLRARKTLRGGDIQRSHNQAVFMRQSILDKFDLLTGASGDVLISAGLQFVSSNLTRQMCLGIVQSLREKGFPKSRHDAVRLRMLPIYKMHLSEMIPDSTTVTSTLKNADKILKDELSGETINVAQYLRKKVRHAFADSTRPSRVIYDLQRFYNQHAWMQIQNKHERIGLRDSLLYCLGRAYQKTGDDPAVKKIIETRAAEDTLYLRMNGK